MKLILKKAVENLGESGDVVEVKPGYARNYLLPHGLAYEASEKNVRLLEEEQKRAGERARRDHLEAGRRAAELTGVSLTFHARAGEDGKLFGSVTAADIADRAKESGLDFELDRRSIGLEEPLKSLGVFMVPIHLHGEVTAEIEVRVEREEG